MLKNWLSASIFVGLSLIMSYLIYTEEYALLGVTFIFFIMLTLTVIDFRFLIYYYFLFGALTSPGFEKVGGMVSVGWLRNTFLLLLYALYLFFILRKVKVYWKSEIFKTYLLGVFPFILYISISFIWSVSPADSLRYVPKYILALVISLIVLLDDKVPVEKSLKMLIYGAFIFLVLSTIGEVFKESLGRSSEYFEGFSGRHQSKYYVVFIIVLLASALISRFSMKYLFLFFGIIYAFIILILILQRGAFLSLLFSFFYIYIYSVKRTNLANFIFFLIISLGSLSSLVVLYQTPKFQEYTFKNATFEDFGSALQKGDIITAFNLIAFKGRLEMWGNALDFFENKIFGMGLATTAVKMEERIGLYMELHNDFLQYLIEGGYIGLGLFLTMWFSLFKISWRYRNASDRTIRFISLSVGAYAFGLFVWSFVDHVLNYSPTNFVFLLILVALLIKATNKSLNNV